ncbi:MAG TPA: hypothetical protein VK831_00855 [Candidatus Deferrimicrobiaceae bacterium]|nr:hypothetical protein [Candidatus Deferrimicrobiaceae bacterium]
MRRTLATMGVALGLAVAACGGGGPAGGPSGTAPSGPDATPTEKPALDGPTGSEGDLEAAARALWDAFQLDDEQAYFAGLSEACRSSAGFGVVSERTNGRHGRIRLAGIDLSAIEVADVTITDFDGHSATVALTLVGTDGNEFLEGQPNAWVYEDDGWHWDNCEPFEAGGGGGELGGSGPDDPIGVGFVPTIGGWYVYSTYLYANADAQVAEGDGPAPPAGTSFYLWGVVVQYDGPNASATLSDDLAFRLVSGGTVYDNPDDCGAYLYALELDFVAAPGEQAPGDICRAVAPRDADSLFLIVTDVATGQEYWFGQE